MWESNYRCYGARRVYKQLRREGHVVARCTVARLMAEMGLRGVQRGRKRFTTVPDATAARPPDLVARRFVADRPDALWLADITYASTWQGWLYVSFILDVYSLAFVCWQIADDLHRPGARRAGDGDLASRPPECVHSGRSNAVIMKWVTNLANRAGAQPRCTTRRS